MASGLRPAGHGAKVERALAALRPPTDDVVASDVVLAYLRKGGAAPTNLTGAIGGGSYETYVMATPDTTGDGNTHAVAGTINARGGVDWSFTRSRTLGL